MSCVKIATKERKSVRELFLVTSFYFLFQLTSASAADLPAVMHYRLDVRFVLKEQRVNVVAMLAIKNSTKKSFTEIPFLLYRLLTVKAVANLAGTPFPFEQNIVQLNDEPSLQARQVIVTPLSPLQPNDSVKLVLTYDGFIFGYPEVMAYVKDRIDENYSLLRPDAFAYPVLAEPTFASVLAANDTKFTYDVTATVPKGYHVACGGEMVDSGTDFDSSTFAFRSKKPTWRIDVAVARFAVLGNPDDNLAVYYLPGDSVGARRVLDASRDVITLYSGIFGRPKSYKGYSIIEIPDGWGSQASDYYFLQTAAAFKDSSRIQEIYHEIGHTWNATASGDVQRCRYFDEAFASFFEALAIRSFQGQKAFEDDMGKSRDIFVQWASYDRQVFDTPIASYGAKELGRHSYTKGAWSLYVLHRLVGDKVFSSIVRTMLTEFDSHTIDFITFQKLCERVAKRDLDQFFQEWIYGIESSKLLVDNVSIADIVRRY
jgi:hypothetical protein